MTAGPASRALRAARPVRHAVFLSDLHLHGGDPAGIARACAFLEAARRDGADAAFLMGDVFRAWMGPRSLRDRGLAPFLSLLAGLSRDGMRVALLHGNHDFLLGPHAERALGVEVARTHLDLALGGLRVRLLHGDALCTRDVDYHRLHRVIRSRPFRALILALPARGASGLATLLLAAANRGTASKPDAEMDIVDEAAQSLLATGLDVVLCGHVHRPRDVALRAARAGRRGEGAPGRLVVLADFERTGSHARWAGGRLTACARDARWAPEPGPVIAIDGPGGSGKSSVSRALAARLGFGHLDSGAVYRAFTSRALESGLAGEASAAGEAGAAGGAEAAARAAALGALARSLGLDVDPGRGVVLLDGRPVPSERLRGPAVSAAVSPLSAVPQVREALLEVQRSAARRARGLVAEGRDMGSVVFPDAVLKVYLDASPEVRVARRAAQERGEGGAREAVAGALAERDRRDAGRAVSPLRLAEDAVHVDSSSLSLDETVARLEEMARRALAGRPAID